MPKDQKLLFSITSKDFDMQTFTVGGHGGGGKDTSNSGVRLIHRDSGAVGEGREHRTNTQNRRSAFEKLVKTDRFKNWLKLETAKRMGQPIRKTEAEIRAEVEARVDEWMRPENLLIETIEVEK